MSGTQLRMLGWDVGHVVGGPRGSKVDMCEEEKGHSLKLGGGRPQAGEDREIT